MVRIRTGESWKVNPTYLAVLRGVGNRGTARFSASSIVDALGLEIDDVDVLRGRTETAVFDAVDHLCAAALTLGRDPRGAAQVALSEDGPELVLGREGARVRVSLVSLGRPPRRLAGEFEVEWVALAAAAADCADGLLRDLQAINPSLATAPLPRRLARNATALRRSLCHSRDGGPGTAAALALQRQSADGALGLRLAFEDDGRLAVCPRGGELYGLLAGGELALVDSEGAAIARFEGPPFLGLSEACRRAAELVAAVESRQARFELPGLRPAIGLRLAEGVLEIPSRSLSCPPLAFARLLLDAALEFEKAVVARSPAQASNPYLGSLRDGALEVLERLEEVERGELFAASGSAPGRESRRPVGEPLTTHGTLKRLRFTLAWKQAALPGRASGLKLRRGALTVAGNGKIAWLSASSGAVRARRSADAVALAEPLSLVVAGNRLAGFSDNGAARFYRSVPLPIGAFEVVGTCTVGRDEHPAILCLFDRQLLAAVLTLGGRVAWQFKPPQSLRSFATAGAGRIFAAAENGWLYRLDPSDGTVAFRVRPLSSFEEAPALGSRLLCCLGRRDGIAWIAVLEADTGRARFERPLGLEGPYSVQLLPRSILVAGRADGASVLAVYDLKGRETMRMPFPSPGLPAFTSHRGRVYAAWRDGSVRCLGPDGQLLWSAPAGRLEMERALAPVLSRDVLLAPGDPLRAFDAASGALLCELAGAGGLSALAASPKLEVFSVDEDGIVSCSRLATHLSVV